MLDNRKKLQLALAKRGYMNEDLVNEIEQIYSKQQLPIHGVVSSFLNKEAESLSINVEDLYINLYNNELTLMTEMFGEDCFTLEDVRIIK